MRGQESNEPLQTKRPQAQAQESAYSGISLCLVRHQVRLGTLRVWSQKPVLFFVTEDVRSQDHGPEQVRDRILVKESAVVKKIRNLAPHDALQGSPLTQLLLFSLKLWLWLRGVEERRECGKNGSSLRLVSLAVLLAVQHHLPTEEILGIEHLLWNQAKLKEIFDARHDVLPAVLHRISVLGRDRKQDQGCLLGNGV